VLPFDLNRTPFPLKLLTMLTPHLTRLPKKGDYSPTNRPKTQSLKSKRLTK